MYPERDSQAEAFDDAVERRRSGDDTPIEDQELQELVSLAERLDRDLPSDTPDPAFRQSLKYQLLLSEPDVQDHSALELVDLEEERWHRRFVTSPWRLSAAAAACMVIIIVAVFSTTNPFSNGSGNGTQDVTSFQPVDSDDADDSFFGNQFPLDLDDGTLPPSEQWFTHSFPPFDSEHVVLPPLLLGFLPLAERHTPSVDLNGVGEMVDDVSIPSNASVYYLNSPPDGSTMLTTLSSTLAIDGELVESSGDGDPYRVIDDEGNDLMRWDPTSAFFHFYGGRLGQPVDDLLDPDAGPEAVARRFLELIGFDFYTIEYESRVVENDNTTEVQLRPVDFPETAMDVTLGGSVYVNGDGSVVEAHLYWLSLVDIEVVALRDRSAIMEDIEHDYGFAPPTTDGTDDISIEADDIMMVHVLTRLGQSNFVLQPAVKIVGHHDGEIASTLPGPARYFVPAVNNGN
jgi:hypothetical protein